MFGSQNWLTKQYPIQEKIQINNNWLIEELGSKQKKLVEIRKEIIKKNLGPDYLEIGEENRENLEKEIEENMELIKKELNDRTTLRNRIKSLENELERLVNLIKAQKEKILNAYLHFFSEKELLKDLINSYLEYSKARKQNLPAVKLRKAFEKLRNELEEKVSEEVAEEIEVILNGCEDLVHWELELETKIENKQKLIEEAKQTINNININVNQGHAFVGNAFGSNATISYTNQQTIELSQQEQ